MVALWHAAQIACNTRLKESKFKSFNWWILLFVGKNLFDADRSLRSPQVGMRSTPLGLLTWVKCPTLQALIRPNQ